MPKFTVITATWNRSHHIIPTIQSVLAQRFDDFEYLIIGDCCTDDTEEIVKPFLSDRLRWLSTSERWKSQSGPNNLGIEQSRGDFIAYIGHDDIWSPDHLIEHLTILGSPAKPDFSVAGFVMHGCPGTGIVTVGGLFPNGSMLNNHLFAPSSLAHRRDVTERIGCWRKPDEIDNHVDAELLGRATTAGMRFVSTGKVTTHKFQAAHRYLSYLEHESDEQDDILGRMQESGFEAELTAWVAASKEQGNFLPSHTTKHTHTHPIALAAYYRELRGVTLPALTALKDQFVLEQSIRPGGSDWSYRGPDRFGFRWTGPNPAPRWLIPVTSEHSVMMDFKLLHADSRVFRNLKFAMNSQPVAHDIRSVRRLGRHFCAETIIRCSLFSDRPSVLRIFHPDGAMIGETLASRRGVAVGPVTISDRPLSLRKKFVGMTRQALRQIAGDLVSVLPVAARRKNP